jgi:hypothetical protein
LQNRPGIPKGEFTMRKILALAAIVALLGCGAARAEPCPFEKHQVTLQGVIVQSAYFRTPYMALVVKHPACDDETMVEVDVPKNWIGHYVTITGDLGGMADREWFSLTIKNIKNGVDGNY